MNRRTRPIILIAASTCVVVILLLFVLMWMPDDDDSEPTESIPAGQASREVASFIAGQPASHEDAGDAPRRVERLRMIDPSLTEEELIELVEESDRFKDALDQHGIVDADLELRHEINETETSEEELRAYFEEHREHFGDRTFEESRGSLESLVKLRKVREKYGGGPSVGDPVEQEGI